MASGHLGPVAAKNKARRPGWLLKIEKHMIPSALVVESKALPPCHLEPVCLQKFNFLILRFVFTTRINKVAVSPRRLDV